MISEIEFDTFDDKACVPSKSSKSRSEVRASITMLARHRCKIPIRRTAVVSETLLTLGLEILADGV